MLEAGGPPALDYINGRIGFNNPSGQLLREAGEVFKHRPIACLINIGNGLPRGNLWRVQDLKRLPLDLFCPAVDNCREPRDMAFDLKEAYFRFDVPRDSFDLSRWDQDEAVRTVVDTVAYLDQEGVQKALDRAVELIIAPTRPLSKQPGDV
jgi:hypothetical protein